MSKQTAVEWLEQQFNDMFYVAEFGEMGKRFTKIFEQAKAMEREQIENAWHAGVSDSDLANSYYNVHYRATAEKYYNETYKGGEQ